MKIRRFLHLAKRLFLDQPSPASCTVVQVGQINYGEILKGKNILITGGGSGIGLSIAKKCIKEGANVLIAGRNAEKLKTVVSEIQSDRLKCIVWDISDLKNLDDRILEAESVFGEIDILVNNAGVYLDESFPEVTLDQWDSVYNTNSKGTYFISQAFCKKWMARDLRSAYKKILIISSQGGFVGANNAYRMTKWDLRGFTEFLGKSMSKHGIICNGIAPGIVLTDMQPSFKGQESGLYTSLNPLNRLALPEEIAELSVFLVSDAANFIVGQTILCDGGYSLN